MVAMCSFEVIIYLTWANLDNDHTLKLIAWIRYTGTQNKHGTEIM